MPPFQEKQKNVWEFPLKEKKNVFIRAIANKNLLESLDEKAVEQARNMAQLPGIISPIVMMPDAHQGYGFCIGGVAAFDEKEGVISPGATGFDINCGVKLVKTNLTKKEITPLLSKLVNELFKKVPTGVGCTGKISIQEKELNEILENGAKWAVEKGYGIEEDLAFTENNGRMKESNNEKVSQKAKERGLKQLGTLGSGNHYLEVQYVSPNGIFDSAASKIMGITEKEQVCLMIHCGSRGLGHQVASDYVMEFNQKLKQKGIILSDRELAYAFFQSQEGQNYFNAMNASANFAFANRQIILHRVREAFETVLGRKWEEMEMHSVYDVTHNMVKEETHLVDGKNKKVIIHRKGATRAFPPHHEQIPEKYQKIGQPVLIGGSMQTHSFVCTGTKKAMELTFGSAMHGAGRTMSRKEAGRKTNGKKLIEEMDKQGIIVRTASLKGLAEEAGFSYKKIEEVVDSAQEAGITKKTIQLTPMGNIKG